MVPLLENEDKLREFLEYCELAVERTKNALNGRGPLQLDHFRRIQHPAQKNENTPVVVLLSKVAWTDIDYLWNSQERPRGDQIEDMRYCRSLYSELFDTFNGNNLTSTTLWSFSRPPILGNDPNQGIYIPNKSASFSSWDAQWKTLNVDINNITGITKLTLTYN